MLCGNMRKQLSSAMIGMALIFLAGSALAQSGKPIDFLGVPGPLEFGGTQYHLAWSSRPSPDYIKQEYVPQGQKPEAFSEMIMLELLITGTGLDKVVKSQTNMLDQRKSSDPVVNYQLFRHSGNNQVILDFLMSDEGSGTRIVEWNAYRYIPITMGDGRNAVFLFAISRRHYGDDPHDFLIALKAKRRAEIDALAAHPVPGFDASK